MAEFLVAMRYSHIVGADASARMLALTTDKNSYRELQQVVLSRPLDFADERFAAVVSAGAFTGGHAPLSGLDAQPACPWLQSHPPAAGIVERLERGLGRIPRARDLDRERSTLDQISGDAIGVMHVAHTDRGTEGISEGTRA